MTDLAVPVDRFYSLFRSVVKVSVLVGLVGLYPAALAFAMLIVPESPGDRLLISIIFTIVSFWVANAFAQKVIHFGQEMRVFLLIKPRQLWSLALRAYGFRIAMLLIVAPLLAAAMFGPKELANPTPPRLWLFGINMVLINALLVMLSVSLSFIPQRLRSLRYAINALFPASLLRLPRANISLFLLLFIIQICRIIWKALGDTISRFFDSLAVWLDEFSERLPMAGQLLSYWFSPHFALMKHARLEGSSWMDMLAFAIATFVLIIALALITHRWISIDIRAAYLESYLANYQGMEAYYRELDQEASEKLAEEAREPGADSNPGNNDDHEITGKLDPPGNAPRSRPAPTRLSQVIGPEAEAYQKTPIFYHLPQEKSPEAFVTGLWPMPKVWPREAWWILLAVSTVIIAWRYRDFAPAVPAMWIVISAIKQIPQNLATSITPQNIWAHLRWHFRKYMLPMLPADFIAALAVPLIASRDWWYVVPSAVALFLVRPFLMIFSVIYYMQAGWSMFVMFICGAGVLIFSIATFITQLSGDPPIGLKEAAMMCGFILAPHLLAWLWFKILVTWKHNNLLHRDARAQ